MIVIDEYTRTHYPVLLVYLAFALVVGAIGLLFARKERIEHKKQLDNPKHGWSVHRLKISRFMCQRCGKQYEDKDYIWQDPEKRLICHVSCSSPGSHPTEDMLNVAIDPVCGPPVSAGRVVAVFAPPPPTHNWENPAAGCGYADLRPGDEPRCTCPPS